MRKRIYEQIKIHRNNGTYSREVRNTTRENETAAMFNEWRAYLELPNHSDEFTKLALMPNFETWINREHGSMSYHLTQVLSGHGCFAKFLCRIGKRENRCCDFCGDDPDDVLHTIRECPAWDPERISLKRTLGLDREFTMADIVEAACGSKINWAAFTGFVQR
ncbi:uncharacterized protein [Polyergus mexicanus]|uniref:uncharacterized protein n=1 Tax=Polyergus mexicanus TaxID=615972 RepID=UPI0038B56A5C